MGASPLYLAVATWGLRSRTILTTEVVSREFRITQQRARDVLHYLRHEARSRLTFENVTVTVPGLRRAVVFRGMRVLHVEDTLATRSRHPAVSPDADISHPVVLTPAKAPVTPLRRLRRWMVSRRPGEPVPVWLTPGA
jgi:hypothetical protein